MPRNGNKTQTARANSQDKVIYKAQIWSRTKRNEITRKAIKAISVIVGIPHHEHGAHIAQSLTRLLL